MKNQTKTQEARYLPPGAASLALRAGTLVLLWWTLTEGGWDDPLFIAVAVLAALWASYKLCPQGEWRWQTLAVIRFLPYFFWNSLLGGIDVAARAFRPHMPLRPEIIDFKLEVSGKSPLLMAWIVSLLPGTASVSLRGDTLKIHVLDTRMPVRKKLRELERRLAPLTRDAESAEPEDRQP